MVDFCRNCTHDLFDVDATDIKGPAWRLCEGCGLHYFDATGRRTCGLPLPAETDITGLACDTCYDAYDEGITP